jgi:hypothetical protein
MKRSLAGFVLLAFATGAATAADLGPVYKAPVAAAVAPSGFYLWMDGYSERLRLPTYALGTYSNGLTPTQTFDPQLSGPGVRGAFGHILPGSTTRVEVGGSYIAARGTIAAETAVPTAPGIPFVIPVFLNGSGATAGSPNCNAPTPCTVAGTLRTDYAAWQVNGKVATDLTYGRVTVTPSAAIFGGNARTNQTLDQTATQAGIGPSYVYTANTVLRWTDFGGRAGLDANVAITDTISVGARGWIGGASRSTSLAGSDNEVPIHAGTAGASAITASSSRFVTLYNIEAGIALKVAPQAALRAFAGLNSDGSVPRITSPIGLPIAAIAPAGIGYARETSYYAGGGISIAFGGPVVAWH